MTRTDDFGMERSSFTVQVRAKIKRAEKSPPSFRSGPEENEFSRPVVPLGNGRGDVVRVATRWSISSHEASGRTAAIPRMISSITSAGSSRKVCSGGECHDCGPRIQIKNRLARETQATAGSIRAQLHSLDPNLPFAEVATMYQLIEQQTLTAANDGIAGVVCDPRFGIGFDWSVRGSFVRSGAPHKRNWIAHRNGSATRSFITAICKARPTMAAVGTAVGLFVAWIFRQAVAQLVFEISPADPLTFSATAVLIAFAVGGSFIPAHRALKADPVVALRYE